MPSHFFFFFFYFSRIIQQLSLLQQDHVRSVVAATRKFHDSSATGNIKAYLQDMISEERVISEVYIMCIVH